MSFNKGCLSRSQGNQREADYLMDCSWFEYYYRIAVHNEYAKDIEEEMNRNKTT